MRVLLDTYSFLWLVTDDDSLSELARTVFLDPDNTLLVSAVTGFEVSVKFSLGKLKLSEPPREFVQNRLHNNAMTALPVTLAHTYRLASLPFHHRDPFDRLLVSQALEEDAPILSADAGLSDYGIERLW